MDKRLYGIAWSCLYLACMLDVSNGQNSGCLDVAIIGGGIGGIYTGYRLRNTGRRIGIFEILDRIGGRMYTSQIPNVPDVTVDFGAMRFLVEMQPNLVNLIKEAGLPIVDFPLNFGNPNETVYYLRGRHLKPEELGGPRTPYNLRPEERLSIDDLLWKLYSENTNMSRERLPTEDEMYTIYTRDGDPLFELSVDEFFERYASREAYRYVRDVRPFIVGPFSADLPLYELVYPKDRDTPVFTKTILGGYGRLPARLLNCFLRASRRHSINLNHQLVSIYGGPRRYTLRFAQAGENSRWSSRWSRQLKSVCARKIVLALQKDNIERISFPPFQNSYFRQRLNSVLDFQAGKVFLAYRNPWWKQGNENITHARSDLQTTTTYDWRTGSNGFVIHLPVYCFAERNVALWRRLKGLGRPIPGSLPGEQAVTTEVKKIVHRYMSRIYRIPESQIPSPVGGGMQMWDRFPFATSWNYYKPGVRMEETRDYMLKPFRYHDVYIVGSSWAPNRHQGFTEGTLLSVNQLLRFYRV